MCRETQEDRNERLKQTKKMSNSLLTRPAASLWSFSSSFLTKWSSPNSKFEDSRVRGLCARSRKGKIYPFFFSKCSELQWRAPFWLVVSAHFDHAHTFKWFIYSIIILQQLVWLTHLSENSLIGPLAVVVEHQLSGSQINGRIGEMIQRRYTSPFFFVHDLTRNLTDEIFG